MNIVICCDGTRGKYGVREKNTNVVRLFERLGQDGSKQISYYDPGVGTYSPFRGGVMGMLDKLAASVSGDGLTSEGIDQNIEEAYRYLMDCYSPGDHVYLFGYSRGAHTVRVLAGMLHKCGLLTKGSDNLIPSMVDIYHRQGNDDLAKRFKNSFSRTCKPRFIGVWDTVASVGWLSRKQFSNNRLNPDVKHGCQALAIDERRHHFRVSRWDENNLPTSQSIEQVWFLGSHGDVGGQNADRAISDISLMWMLEGAEAKGLRLKKNWPEKLRPNHAGRIKRSDRHIWRFGAEDRAIPDGAKLHQSVLDRRDDPTLDYRPRNLPRSYEVVKGANGVPSDDESSPDPDQPETMADGAFLEQYKVMTQSVDNVSARRVNINQYQTAMNLGIVTLYGAGNAFELDWWVSVVVALAGIAISANWLLTIRSMTQLNSAKFKVIDAMEDRLPKAVFRDEWRELGGERSWTYKGATFFEKMVPPVFALIHVGVLIYTLL